MIKPENYIVIQGFMRTELDLSGNDLLLYALIYGFSQTDNQRFTGSLQYAADWLGCSKQTIINSLKSLISKDLIAKVDKTINGVKFCEYQAKKRQAEPVESFEGYTKNLNGVCKNLDGGYTKNLNGGMQKSLLNKIDQNIKEKTVLNNSLIPTVEEIRKRVAVIKQEAEEHYERMQNV